MKMTMTNFLISMVVCVAVFILGMLQYYTKNSNPLAGNYMMAASTLIVFLIFFALYSKAIKKMIKKQSSKYVLFSLPLLGSYFLAMISIMALNLLNMHDSYSIFKEIGTTSFMMTTSVGYWSIFVVLEAIVLLLLITKKLTVEADSNNQL